jgi:hypothetical protein
MAVNPKAVASWGLLSDAGGGIIKVTQVLQEVEVTLAAAAPLAVNLEAAAISVTLSDDQKIDGVGFAAPPGITGRRREAGWKRW